LRPNDQQRLYTTGQAWDALVLNGPVLEYQMAIESCIADLIKLGATRTEHAIVQKIVHDVEKSHRFPNQLVSLRTVKYFHDTR